MPTPSRSDESDDFLIHRVATRRDEGAFRALYRRHGPALLRTLEGVLEDRASAEDCAQESWVVAIERLATFRRDAAFRTWLVGIGFNIARAMRRYEGRRKTEALPETIARPAAPPELQLDLDRAVATLADGHRTVFLLHDVEGYTHEEIAEQLGVTAGTSKSQLFHARRALRTLLTAEVSSHVS